LLDVEVHLQLAALDFFTVHCKKSFLGVFGGLELDVRKAFGLLGLPVVSQANGLDFAEFTETVADIVFLKFVRKAFDEQGFAVRWHLLSGFTGLLLI